MTDAKKPAGRTNALPLPLSGRREPVEFSIVSAFLTLVSLAPAGLACGTIEPLNFSANPGSGSGGSTVDAGGGGGTNGGGPTTGMGGSVPNTGAGGSGPTVTVDSGAGTPDSGGFVDSGTDLSGSGVSDAAGRTGTGAAGMSGGTGAGGRAGTGTGGSPGAGGGTGTGTGTFAAVAALLMTNCSSCHNGTNHTDLRTAGLGARIVNGSSNPSTNTSCTSQKLIVPNSTATSLIYNKVMGTNLGGCGNRMPMGCSTTSANPRACLTTAQIATIAAWINAGAPTM
jgi:hypothetical protein